MNRHTFKTHKYKIIFEDYNGAEVGECIVTTPHNITIGDDIDGDLFELFKESELFFTVNKRTFYNNGLMVVWANNEFLNKPKDE